MNDVAGFLARDAHAQALGVVLLDAAEASVTVALTVEPSHANSMGVGHGAVTYALADIALSLISNRDRTAVSVDTHLALVGRVDVGEQLRAVATPVREGRSMATYRVDVAAGERLVATFTGTVHVLKA